MKGQIGETKWGGLVLQPQKLGHLCSSRAPKVVLSCQKAPPSCKSPLRRLHESRESCQHRRCTLSQSVPNPEGLVSKVPQLQIPKHRAEEQCCISGRTGQVSVEHHAWDSMQVPLQKKNHGQIEKIEAEAQTMVHCLGGNGAERVPWLSVEEMLQAQQEDHRASGLRWWNCWGQPRGVLEASCCGGSPRAAGGQAPRGRSQGVLQIVRDQESSTGPKAELPRYPKRFLAGLWQSPRSRTSTKTATMDFHGDDFIVKVASDGQANSEGGCRRDQRRTGYEWPWVCHHEGPQWVMPV